MRMLQWTTESLACRPALWIASLTALLICGCAVPKLEDEYGRRRGVLASKSVNGTSVLASMFETRGWDVASWDRLSPKLREADAVVWVPDSFSPPSDEQVDWLEDWLSEDSDRTLVFVGRDFDSAPAYWNKIAPLAPPKDKGWTEEARKQAQFVWDSDRRAMSDPSKSRWYKMSPRKKASTITSLSGDSAWAKGIDASKLEISLRVDLHAPKSDDYSEIETLLASSDGDLLAYRLSDEYGMLQSSQVIVVANGSFLLNMPLVNREHRKLAGKVIDACEGEFGPSRVIFLEQTPLKLKIYDTDPVSTQRSSFTMLTIWPLGFLLLHLFVLGLFACLIAFPIYGRAMILKDVGVSDFSKHIKAVGSLVGATQNRQYALERLKYYQEHVRRDRDS